MSTPVLDFDAPAVIDGPYRYSLTRSGWLAAPTAVPLVVVMLNPSTADATTDDPTITRIRHRAMRDAYLDRKRVQFGRLVVVNLYALRSADPRALTRHPDPVGPGNDEWVMAAARLPGAVVVAAWGASGPACDRSPAIRHLLANRAGVDLYCLGRTPRTGQPRHPLYVPAAQPLELYAAGAAV